MALDRNRPIVKAALERKGFVDQFGARWNGDQLLRMGFIEEYVAWCETNPTLAPHPILSLEGVLLT